MRLIDEVSVVKYAHTYVDIKTYLITSSPYKKIYSVRTIDYFCLSLLWPNLWVIYSQEESIMDSSLSVCQFIYARLIWKKNIKMYLLHFCKRGQVEVQFKLNG